MLIFYGNATLEIDVDLPEEEQDVEHCGSPVKSMYGTQNAPANFQCIRWEQPNESEDCRILVHGIDFCAVGDQDAIDVLSEVLRRVHELKITDRVSMSSDGSESKIMFLNRVLRIVHSENRPILKEYTSYYRKLATKTVYVQQEELHEH